MTILNQYDGCQGNDACEMAYVAYVIACAKADLAYQLAAERHLKAIDDAHDIMFQKLLAATSSADEEGTRIVAYALQRFYI
jgi:hypothetical protein